MKVPSKYCLCSRPPCPQVTLQQPVGTPLREVTLPIRESAFSNPHTVVEAINRYCGGVSIYYCLGLPNNNDYNYY